MGGGAPCARRFEVLEPRCHLTAAVGPEFLINTQTTDTQQPDSATALGADGAGNVVVVWESHNQDSLLTWGVYGQRYNSSGAAQGSEFLINATLLDDQRAPAVAVNSTGDFVVAWEGRGLLGLLFPGIYVQRYNSAGVAQGSEIGVEGSALLAVNRASVAMNASGGFVVTWEQTSAGRDIAARLYDSGGSPLGPAFIVNATVGGNQRTPQVAMDPSGRFLVTWNGNGTGDGGGVFGRLFDATGAALTGEFLINSTVGGTQNQSALAVGPGGEFVVTWAGNGGGDSAGVFGRRFDASGVALGAEFLVNQTTSGTQQRPSVSIDPDGEFLIGWSGEGVGDLAGVFAREYWSDGTPKSGEFAVNTTTGGTQSIASVAAQGDNAYTVAWSGAGPGDGAGVFGQRFENAAPAVTTSVGSVSFTEDGAAVAVDAGLVITDSDSSTPIGASVTITGNYAATQDSLLFTDTAQITGGWDSLTGTLTLTGTATLADYQAALRSVLYFNSSQDPLTSPRTVSFTVSDGTGSSATASRTLDVLAVNDAPVMTMSTGSASFVEDGLPVLVDPGLTLSDVDSSTLASATVAVTGNYASGRDILTFTDTLLITGSWDGLTGTLTLTGVATIADYVAALRGVLYSNSSQDPFTAQRTVTFVVHDGTDSSAPGTRSLAVTAVNDAPAVTASSGSSTLTEDAAPVPVDPALLVTDVDSSVLAWATVTITGNYASSQDTLLFTDTAQITGNWDSLTGTLTLTGAATLADYQAALRSVRYANSSQDPLTAVRTVTFLVQDGTDSSAPAARDIAVVAVNDAPVVSLTPGSASFTEDGAAVAVDSGLVLTDVDTSTIVWATVTITGNYVSSQDALLFIDTPQITGSWDSLTGTLTLTGAAAIADYQAALRSVLFANSNQDPLTAPRAVTFAASDGTDGSAAANRTVTVAGSNDAPVATSTSGTASFNEGGAPVVVDTGILLSDVDSSMLVSASVSITGNYAAGEDLLLFTDTALIFGTWNGLAGTLTLTGAATVAEYQAALRSVRYANSSQDPLTAPRTVAFLVYDGADASNLVTRGVHVTAVNDAPLVTTSAGSGWFTEDGQPVVVDPGLSMIDADSSMLAWATVTVAGNYVSGQDTLLFTNTPQVAGSWDSLTGTLTLMGAAPLADYRAALRTVLYSNGSQDPNTAARTLTIVVHDGADSSATATRSIVVVAVNDAPVMTTSSGSSVFTEDEWPMAVDPGLVLSDADSATLTSATVTISGNYTVGEDTLVFADMLGITGNWESATGSLTLTGAASRADYQAALRSVRYANSSQDPLSAARTVTFAVSDGTGNSAPASRLVGVVGVNDAPVVTTSEGAASFTEDGVPVSIDPDLLLVDADSPILISASVTITGNYVADQDALQFTDTPLIAGTWESSTGMLSLTGAATLAEYQAALRSVAYFNSSQNSSTAIRTVTLAVSDGNIVSAAVSRAVTVTAVVDLPPDVGDETPVPSPTPSRDPYWVPATQRDAWLAWAGLSGAIVARPEDHSSVQSAATHPRGTPTARAQAPRWFLGPPLFARSIAPAQAIVDKAVASTSEDPALVASAGAAETEVARAEETATAPTQTPARARALPPDQPAARLAQRPTEPVAETRSRARPEHAFATGRADLGSPEAGLTTERIITLTVAVGFAAGTGFYSWRYMRRGVLLANVLMALPVWRWFDPVPVLDSWEKAAQARQRKSVTKVEPSENAAWLQSYVEVNAAPPPDDKECKKAA